MPRLGNIVTFNFVCFFVLLVNRCPVMLVVGQSSAHLNDTIDMNSKLDPKNSTWVKVCCPAVNISKIALVSLKIMPLLSWCFSVVCKVSGKAHTCNKTPLLHCRTEMLNLSLFLTSVLCAQLCL